MAKIITKKKQNRRKMTLKGFALIIFLVAITVKLWSCLFLGAMNNAYTIKIEDINQETMALKEENVKINLEIQNLISKDRVYDIANDAGLTQEQDRVVNVVKGE